MPSLRSVIDRLQNAFVPASHHLACNAAKWRLLGGGETEALSLKHFATRFETAIDVGANQGHYTYEMSRLFKTVWSFEPNSRISQTIRSARLTNVNLVNAALSCDEGEGILKLPVVQGQVLDGWASLEPNVGESFHEIATELRTLDSFGISDVDFIKIDVEGHELSVLHGGARTIEAWRPICLIEVDKSNIETLTAFFRARDYSAHRSWRGTDISPHNLLFVPNEKASLNP